MRFNPTKILILLFIYSIDCQNLSNNELTENSTNIKLSNNVTEVYNTTEVPIETTTTTSSEHPFEEEEAFRHYIHYNEDYCVCNLHLNWCDIDCCCDIDCSDAEKSSFGECIQTRKQIYDSRYCSNKNIVYINNTETSVEMSSNGLFCIVWDNTNQRHLFSHVNPINDVNRLVNIRPQHSYDWSLKNIKKVIKSSDSQFSQPDFKMKSGRYLLIAKQSNDSKIEDNWELPHNMVFKEGECNSHKRVKYMKDFRSTCYRFIRDLTHECLSNEYLNLKYYNSFDFVSKNFGNQSETKKIYINISFVNSSDIEFEAPTYDSKNKICRNSVKSVEYIIRHNGSYGIINATLAIQTIDLKHKTKWFEQSFGVTFIWFNKSNVIELSGNPGYIVGKPILAASRTQDMNLTRNFSGYKILAQNNGIFCHQNSTKSSIKFGTNSRSGCLLKFDNRVEDDLCKSIQETIDKVLGPDPPLNSIGIFGNSSSEISSDWVSIQTPADSVNIDPLNEGKCPILTTGTSLHIYYVFAGSANQPQLKIVGAVKRLHTQNDVRVKCDPNSVNCNDLVIELSTSVTFFDITKPSRPDYAPPVTFKIQLPSDFFYPFLTSSSSFNSLIVNKMLLIVTLINSFKLK